MGLLLKLPHFDLKKVKVSKLVKIEEKEILEKANFELDKNIFLQNYISAEREIEKIKSVKNADINIEFPNTIRINVEERMETYQIKTDDGYYIIDEQGYMLKKIQKRGNLPELVGIEDKFEDDNRLYSDELTRLEEINKIYNTAKIINLDGLITEIKLKSIGFELNFANNKKRSHFDSTNNLINSMQIVREVVCSTEDANVAGDIYVTDEGVRFKSK